MNKGYYVLRANRWGNADNLYEAMRNCNLFAPNRYTNGIELIEEFHDNEEDLRDGFEELAKYPEAHLDEGTEKFQVIITDADNWKLSRTDDLSGSPSYDWVGKGLRPDGYVPTHSIVGELNFRTGEIKIEKHQLPETD
jgi:hypothetical protein